MGRRRGSVRPASVLEPLIDFVIAEAAAGRFQSPIGGIDADAMQSPSDEDPGPSRWGPWGVRFVEGRHQVVALLPGGRPGFDADVTAFLASRYAELRPESLEPSGPVPRPGETVESTMGGWGWLYRVDDPAGYGRRLVCGARMKPGLYLVWEMPGYSQRDAHDLAWAFMEGYL